jgi:hypothetical protein
MSKNNQYSDHSIDYLTVILSIVICSLNDELTSMIYMYSYWCVMLTKNGKFEFFSSNAEIVIRVLDTIVPVVFISAFIILAGQMIRRGLLLLL